MPRLKKTREAHAADGPPDQGRIVLAMKDGQIQNAQLGDYPTGPVQLITSFGSMDNSNTYQAGAFSSISDSPAASYLSLGIYDQSGNLQGNLAESTEYYSGTNQELNNEGTIDPTDVEAKAIASYSWVDKVGLSQYGSVYASSSITPPTTIDPGNPKDVNGDGIIKVCLERAGADCDYQPEGGSGTNVILPINGSITYSAPIDQPFDSANAYSLITIARPEVGEGGGCHIESTDNFFDPTYTTVNGDTLTWNLAPAHFQPASGCLNANAAANYTFNVMIKNFNLPVFVSITDVPNAVPGPYTKVIPPMQVWFSCVAEGTEVLLEDGTRKLIEAIVADDRVIIDGEKNVMTVRSTLKGKEEKPILQLTTAAGQTVEVTGGHTVKTDKGVILAQDLKVGDLVDSIDGYQALTSITEKPYDGHVYNLVLGTDRDEIEKSMDNTTFYANGIRVGDAKMQYTYGKKSTYYTQMTPEEILKKLPVKWHKDFQSDMEKVAATQAFED